MVTSRSLENRGGSGARRIGRVAALLGGTLWIGAGTPLIGQEPSEPSEDRARVVPTNAFVVSGYGTTGYLYRTQGDNRNEFFASVNPIFLFQFQDRVLFETELEFAVEEGVTETGLEFAALNFLATDNLTLVAGKFLVPFGVFGERIHPTWINKFPSSPPIYGHGATGFGVRPLMPVLADLGAMARVASTPGPWQLGLSAYVTQGPSLEEHDEEPEGEGGEGVEGQVEIPDFDFPASSGDNNRNKMLGARFDIALPPWFEVNFSFLNGDYDEENVLDFSAWNVAGEARYKGFELRGEYMQTRQEIETEGGFPTLVRNGMYAQLEYRWQRWAPIIRWTQTFDSKLDGEPEEEGAHQAAFGLSYWFAPSIALMGGYEINREDGERLENDRFLIHVAFGF